jgi:murein L,D-transpeptidase YafK
MRKIALFIAMLLFRACHLPGCSAATARRRRSAKYKQQLMGSPVYIQIFKEERTLDVCQNG